jgi:hypothetical protein
VLRRGLPDRLSSRLYGRVISTSGGTVSPVRDRPCYLASKDIGDFLIECQLSETKRIRIHNALPSDLGNKIRVHGASPTRLFFFGYMLT